jgi:hypothetical protein
VVAFHREIDSSKPFRYEPVGRVGGRHERRPLAGAWHLGVGTLACPDCDAPVAPPLSPMAPSDPLGCGFCGHESVVRDFLSLAPPPRPTRVDVRVVQRARA